jgi:hypothetical protein
VPSTVSGSGGSAAHKAPAVGPAPVPIATAAVGSSSTLAAALARALQLPPDAALDPARLVRAATAASVDATTAGALGRFARDVCDTVAEQLVGLPLPPTAGGSGDSPPYSGQRPRYVGLEQARALLGGALRELAELRRLHYVVRVASGATGAVTVGGMPASLLSASSPQAAAAY